MAAAIAAAFAAGRLRRDAGPRHAPPEAPKVPPLMPRSSPEANDIGRYELAKVAYDQVLDATKHQDDKVGRVLTAVAFLTAAAIAFGTRSDVLGVQYNLDGLVPLPGVLFSGFFALVVISVVFLLMALGQALGLPRTGSAKGERSRLFFLVISDETEDQWVDRWNGTNEEIRESLTSNLIVEAYNIATRADKKYRRTGEAQAIFTWALMLFGLAIALAINVLARQAKGPAQWDLRSRLVATVVLTSFSVSLGYGWVRSGQKLVVRVGKKTQWPLYAVWGLAAIFPASVLLPPYVVSAQVGAVIATGIVLVSGYAVSAKLRQGVVRLAAIAVSVAIAALTGEALWMKAERLRLILAGTSVALFELPRLLSATASWRHRNAGIGGPVTPDPP